jgi:hypothetical protein
MRKNNRLLFIFTTVLLACVSTVYGQPKAKLPKANQVVVVARFSMIPDLDLDFFWKFSSEYQPEWSKVSWINRAEGASLGLEIRSNWETYFNFGTLGELSAAVLPIPKDRTIIIKDVSAELFSNQWLIFKLPLYCKIVIPEGANYVYIGSLDYVTKDEFLEIQSINRRDEYDLARDFVHKNYSVDAQLVRVNLLDLDKDKE